MCHETYFKRKKKTIKYQFIQLERLIQVKQQNVLQYIKSDVCLAYTLFFDFEKKVQVRVVEVEEEEKLMNRFHSMKVQSTFTFCNTNITHTSPSSTPFVSSLIIPDGAKSQFPIRNLFTTKVVDTFTY